MSEAPILDVHGVSARYGVIQALWDVSLHVGPGEVVAIAGPNGAGKTTLLKTVAGVVDVSAGTIALAGRDATRLSYRQRLRAGIGWVPEGRQLFGSLTIEQNLYLSARMAGCSAREFRERREKVFDIFPAIADRPKTPAGKLSGGEQQMVAIGRAIVRQPSIILLDEPSAGLAPSVVLVLADVVRKLQEFGAAVLVAEQNIGWLPALEGRAYMIRGGAIIASGGMDLLTSRDAMRSTYLGS